MKRMFFTMIALFMLSAVSFSQSGTTGPLTWELSNGTLTVSGTGAMPDYPTGSSTPWSSYTSSITAVVIENNVTSIGDWAFYYCVYLNSVTIGNSVTSIGDKAFYWCTGLISVTIPESVTSIGIEAFYYCTGLTAIDVSENNTAYASENGVLFNKAKSDLIQYPAGKQNTSYTIPNSVTSIGGNAFSSCSILTSVTIPESVTSIGEWAFSGCHGLTSVTIPESVKSIGDAAFNYCSALPTIDVSENNTAYASENGVLFNKAKSALIQYPAGKQDVSYTIPNSVTSIGNRAFYWCSRLTEITIGNNVTSIGIYAFFRCSGLTEITIPNSVTSIEGSAFSYCSGLTSVTNLNPAPQSINSGVFFDVALSNATLYVPAESIESYKDAAVWKDFGDIISAFSAFYVSITSGNPSMGTVTGTGYYAENSTATISATANPGYKFVKWDDDDTQNPRTITVTQDTTYTAIFEAITYHLTVNANNPSMGTVAGTGDYEENSTVTISATANPGYKFVKWDDDDTQNPRTITVTQDTTYTAIFDVNTNIQQTSDNGVSIYPNPVTESFRINGINAPTEVTVTDLSGRTVLQQIVEAGESVAVGNLPKGVYIVRAGGKTLKVVKK